MKAKILKRLGLESVPILFVPFTIGSVGSQGASCEDLTTMAGQARWKENVSLDWRRVERENRHEAATLEEYAR